ncbi:PAS domain-containing protein [Dankookia sp. P2]|uniref:PAS domain-containing protein n=1 Tax=Dankookia sp. P2 TaxID=3423955 RepID=UPI003D664836
MAPSWYREPALPGGPDRVAQTSPVFRRVGEGQARASFTDVSTLDGRRRVYSYRRVGAWPVYVSFGADADLAARSLVRQPARLWGGRRRGGADAADGRLAGAARRPGSRGGGGGAAAGGATARVAAEARQAAEARFRAVFDSRAVGMAVLDLATGQMLVANDRLLEMIGTSRPDLRGGRVGLAPGDRARACAAVRDRTAAGAGGWLVGAL